LSGRGGIRVIAGEARGKKLRLVPGDTTRPITDRVKENLFNIIGQDIRGSQFLDLFGGTGGVGIEALSRGAAFAQFLDLADPAIRTIHENLKTAGFTERAKVLRADAFQYLASTPSRAFDYIYIAPPQYRGLWEKALLAVDKQTGWLAPQAWAIAQIDPKEEKEPAFKNLTLFDRRKYGNTLLLFFNTGIY